MQYKKYSEWDGRKYQEVSRLHDKVGLLSIERLDPQDGEKILEIGCGPGMQTVQIARKIPKGKIIAIDNSEDMVEQAKFNVTKNGIDNAEIICMDALEINFIDEFDAVFSNSAVPWIQNQKLLYEKIYRSLKPNGRILIETQYIKTDMKPLLTNNMAVFIEKVLKLDEFIEYSSEISKLPSIKIFTPKKNEILLKRAHFSNIILETYPFKDEFRDIDELLNQIKQSSLIPILSLFPDNLKAHFIECLKKEISELEEKSLDVELPVLFIHAQKVT